MKMMDITLWGWYQLLDKTLYSYGNHDESFTAKEHGFAIAFFLHGLNVYTLMSYFAIEFLEKNVELYISMPAALIVFFIGYLIYFRGNRIQKILSYDVSNIKGVLYIVITILYSVASVYLMIKTGDYVRAILLGEQ